MTALPIQPFTEAVRDQRERLTELASGAARFWAISALTRPSSSSTPPGRLRPGPHPGRRDLHRACCFSDALIHLSLPAPGPGKGAARRVRLLVGRDPGVHVRCGLRGDQHLGAERSGRTIPHGAHALSGQPGGAQVLPAGPGRVRGGVERHRGETDRRGPGRFPGPVRRDQKTLPRVVPDAVAGAARPAGRGSSDRGAGGPRDPARGLSPHARGFRGRSGGAAGRRGKQASPYSSPEA